MTQLALEARPSTNPLTGGGDIRQRNRQGLLLAAVGGVIAVVGLLASLAGGPLLPANWRVPGLGADFYDWLLAAAALAFVASQVILLVPLVFPIRLAHAWPSASGRAMEATWTALPILLTLVLGIWIGWV